MGQQLLLIFKNVDLNLINNLKQYGNALAIDDGNEQKIAIPLKLGAEQIFSPIDLIQIDPGACIELGIYDGKNFKSSSRLTELLAKKLPNMNPEHLSISILMKLDDFLHDDQIEIQRAFKQVEKQAQQQSNKSAETNKPIKETDNAEVDNDQSDEIDDEKLLIEFEHNLNDPYLALAIRLFESNYHKHIPTFTDEIRSQLGETLIDAETVVENEQRKIILTIYHRLKNLDLAKQLELDPLLKDFDDKIKVQDQKLSSKAKQVEKQVTDNHEAQSLKQQIQSLEFELAQVKNDKKQLEQKNGQHDDQTAKLTNENVQLVKENDALNQQLKTLTANLEQQRELNQKQQALQTKLNTKVNKTDTKKQKIFGYGIIGLLIALIVMMGIMIGGVFSHKEAPANNQTQPTIVSSIASSSSTKSDTNK